MYITKNIPLILDSGNSKAQTASDGSDFTVRMNPQIIIPIEAINVEVGLLSCEVYNSFQNLVGASHEFKFTITAGGTTADIDIPIPAGAYSLETLAETVTRFCEKDHRLPDSMFTFVLNPATRKVTIQVDYTSTSPLITLTTVTINFDHANMTTIASLLGFCDCNSVALGTIDPLASVKEVTGSDNATINERPDQIHVRSDLATGGIDPKGESTTILAAFAPQVPGALVLYEPQNILWHECSVANGSFSSVFVQLTDGDGLPLNTNGRTFKVQLEIKYLMWVAEPADPKSQLIGSGYGR